jgi:oligo-alginate lyase
MRGIILLLACAATLCAAERFPKPKPGEAFRELKIYNNGSPVRAAQEDWAGARERVTNDPQWRAWVDQQRKTVDDWIARRRDRVEWIAGWHHDFVSPKDGSFLTWTPEPPGKYLSSPSDAQVEVTEKLFTAWVFRFRSQHASRMEEAAQLYRLTGDAKYADWVASQIEFYADNYEKWPIQTRLSKSRLMAQSLDEAVNLVRYVNAARLIWDRVSEERRKAWHEKLFRPEALLLDETLQRIHNIACWQRSAQAQVALLFKDEELWKRAIDGRFGIRRQVAEGVTSEYLWFEQSMGYNSYVVSALMPLFTYASLAGRGDELRQEMEAIQNLMLSPVYMRFPNGQVPNPADITGGAARAPNRGLMASTYRVFPTAIGLREAAKVRSWNTLLDPPAETSAGVELPEVRSWNLESSRMAILKKGPWQVYFHYGQVDASHAQAEALNYEAFFRDTRVTDDPGTVGYGSPLHAGYYKTGLAHNVPLVDGVGQQGWKEGELVTFDAVAGVVEARQPEYRKDAKAGRRLRIDGDRLIDEVVVTKTSGGAGRLGLVVHVQGSVAVPESYRPVESFAYWTNTRGGTARDEATFAVRFEDGRTLRLRVATAGAFRVVHGSAPDVPPRRNEVLYFEVEGESAKFEMVWEGQD